MSAPRKKWDDHSPRWKRKAAREGLTKARWDRWLKLSKDARKNSDARKYAAGQSVAKQITDTLRRQVFTKLHKLHGADGNIMRIRHNVFKMTNAQLKWTLKATPGQIISRASKPTAPVGNPWWYH